MVRNNTLKLILILTLLLTLFCVGATLRDLTYPDELRYAEVAREMLESGDWLLPSFNYETYTEKPPFFFWLVAVSMRSFGSHPLAVILPVAVSALLTLLMTYLLGRELFSPPVAMLGTWILSTFLLFLLMAQIARMDMTLTLLVTSTIYFFVRRLKSKSGTFTALLPAYLFLGIALITKGPVGLILTLLPLLCYLLFAREWGRLKDLHLGRGLLVTAAIPLLWVVPAALSGGEAFLEEILVTQSVARVMGSLSHNQPVYYYLLYFVPLFFPWSFFLLLLFDPGIRQDLLPHRKEVIFLLCWIVGPLIFFSLIASKIVIYLLPTAPALALLLARLVHPACRELTVIKRPLLFKSAAFVVSAICLAGAAFIWAPRPKLAWMTEAVSFAPVMAVLGMGGIVLATCAYRNRPAGAVLMTGMVPLLLTGTIALWIIPGLNPHLSLKPVARRILTIEENSPRVGGYRTDFRYLAYYLHAPYQKINTPDELNQFIQTGLRFLIIDREDRQLVTDAANRPLLEVGQFVLKGKTFSLFIPQERPEGSFDFIIG